MMVIYIVCVLCILAGFAIQISVNIYRSVATGMVETIYCLLHLMFS